ncbi:uncharacterized protein LOC144100743 [Amblyomma americanum]
MYIIPLAFAAILLPLRLHGSQKFLDNNPALGAYQDVIKCFPAHGTLYLLYRNYEYDPYYGGTAKCVYATQNDPVINDSTFITIGYENTERRVRMTFLSGPGSTVKNEVNFKALDGSGDDYNITVAYVDCPKCHVLRSNYIDRGAGCQLYVPEDALQEENACCHFVYDLLCGTSPKYQIYEDCN